MDCKREEIQARATSREFFFKSLIRERKTCIWTGAMARENGGESKQRQGQCVPIWLNTNQNVSEESQAETRFLAHFSPR